MYQAVQYPCVLVDSARHCTREQGHQYVWHLTYPGTVQESRATSMAGTGHSQALHRSGVDTVSGKGLMSGKVVPSSEVITEVLLTPMVALT